MYTDTTLLLLTTIPRSKSTNPRPLPLPHLGQFPRSQHLRVLGSTHSGPLIFADQATPNTLLNRKLPKPDLTLKNQNTRNGSPQIHIHPLHSGCPTKHLLPFTLPGRFRWTSPLISLFTNDLIALST